MRKIIVAAVLLSAATATTMLVSCEKKTIKPNATHVETKKPALIPGGRGIRSIHSFLGANQLKVDYFEINPSFSQQLPITEFAGPAGSFPTLRGFACFNDNPVYAYRDTSGTDRYVIEDLIWGPQTITLGGSNFVTSIKEIEINPATQELYMLAGSNAIGGMKLYHIDPASGAATLIGSLLGSVAESSITFVENGSGGFTLVFTYQTATVSSAVISMKYYSISGTTLTFIDSYTYPANPIPFGTTLNTAFDPVTDKLHIARDGGNLYSYTLPLPNSSTTTPPTATLEVNAANFANKYDFGFWFD